MDKLDDEEREILEAFDAGTLTPIADKEKEMEKHRQYAREPV